MINAAKQQQITTTITTVAEMAALSWSLKVVGADVPLDPEMEAEGTLNGLKVGGYVGKRKRLPEEGENFDKSVDEEKADFAPKLGMVTLFASATLNVLRFDWKVNKKEEVGCCFTDCESCACS